MQRIFPEIIGSKKSGRSKPMIEVCLATEEHGAAIAVIHRDVFQRQLNSEAWVKATLAAFPRFLSFVALNQGAVIGYIFWGQKSGIRASAVLELDQIAIAEKFRGRGFGQYLIRKSLAGVAALLAQNHQAIKSILVCTRSDNTAQRLYTAVLGARVEAEIHDLYSGTEVFMVARELDAQPGAPADAPKAARR